ncbi:MAG: hypothetical protein IJ390_11970 [Lachnospiraceae bacterium]|nr:hypothetical protein [Lachnospiraceae bacterium]
MANDENLKRGGLTQFRSGEEAARNGAKGGRASGEARRRKADFRKTLNLLLTAKIDSPEWTPLLESLGLDSTLEAAVNAAMIREALNGNVKAYEAIAKYSGQSDRTEADHEEQRARVDKEQAQTEAIKKKSELGEADEIEDDGFVDALKGNASGDWADEETDI